MNLRLLVAIPRPIHNSLTYAPADALNLPALGSRVIVPLANHSSIGIVTAYTDIKDESYTIKPIKTILDTEPLLDEHLLKLLQWAAQYYQHPIGEVIFSALPSHLRQGKRLAESQYWKSIHHPQWQTLLGRAKRQAELYQWLEQQNLAVSEETIKQFSGNAWKQYLRALLDKNLVIQTDANLLLQDHSNPTIQTHSPLSLSEQQQDCLDHCMNWIADKQPKPMLLHGVTGSGKTEIYLRLIEAILQKKQQVLVLVPEIGLTPQLLQRFKAYFPKQTILALHSNLSGGERLNAWLQARNQQAHIIIGTRSAVFTPCPNLGLIIIDEEHDSSLKQQEGFRYHGRDLAIKRAHMLGIPILLGSATPALETLHNAEQGKYRMISLAQRPGKARPPQLEVQDIRGLALQSGLSEHSFKLIRATLERQEQVMVFINRRGFAPIFLCGQCGWQADCPSCSAKMTYHARRGLLLCHHCGTEQSAPQRCPQCGNEQLTTQGHGTERIELVLKQHFPNTDVLRIDRDSTSRKGSLEKQLATIHQQERLILVGTQMLAKGHDFPNLTLVVVLDVDHALLSSEYHSLERFGQLITQVAGRAGRSHKAGRVILQTTQAQHPSLLTLLEKGYLAFAKALLLQRQAWQLPPFSHQALLRADAKHMDDALNFLQMVRELLMQQDLTGIILLGPVPAPMEKRADRYRAQLLLQTDDRQKRRAYLKTIHAQRKNLRNQHKVRWSIDIDPVELS